MAEEEEEEVEGVETALVGAVVAVVEYLYVSFFVRADAQLEWIVDFAIHKRPHVKEHTMPHHITHRTTTTMDIRAFLPNRLKALQLVWILEQVQVWKNQTHLDLMIILLHIQTTRVIVDNIAL